MDKVISKKESKQVLKVYAVNWVIDRSLDNKLTYHDWTVAYIKELLTKRFFNMDQGIISLSDLSENDILWILHEVNKYVCYSLDKLSTKYELIA